MLAWCAEDLITGNSADLVPMLADDVGKAQLPPILTPSSILGRAPWMRQPLSGHETLAFVFKVQDSHFTSRSS